MDFVHERTGVRPALGGTHPGRGTCNALLALGERRYLEIIAPDPGQRKVSPWLTSRLPSIITMHEPEIVGWAARPDDIERLAAKLRRSGLGIDGVHAQSRSHANGTVLNWKMLRLLDDRQAILPFLIEWDANSRHPAADAPAGCRLERFTALVRNPVEFTQLFELLEVDVDIAQGNAPRLQVSIAGPSGRLDR